LFESIDPDMVWDKIRGSASGSLTCELANDVVEFAKNLVIQRMGKFGPEKIIHTNKNFPR